MLRQVPSHEESSVSAGRIFEVILGARVRAGLRNAKAKGTVMGRAPLRVFSPKEVRMLRRGPEPGHDLLGSSQEARHFDLECLLHRESPERPCGPVSASDAPNQGVRGSRQFLWNQKRPGQEISTDSRSTARGS